MNARSGLAACVTVITEWTYFNTGVFVEDAWLAICREGEIYVQVIPDLILL
jgi:hypothetical protein